MTDRQRAYYCCHPPGGAGLAELAAVAGSRWAVEDCFAAAKNEASLDHYQVRRSTAWYRHITLAMLATAYLAVIAAGPTPTPNTASDPVGSAEGPEKGDSQGVDDPAAPAPHSGRPSRNRTPAPGSVDPGRDPAAARRPDPTTPYHRPHPELVTLATPPPSTS